MAAPSTTLIATLGGQPQIITITLDLLLARGFSIDQVIAVYPAYNQRYRDSFNLLAGEFVGDRYSGRRCHLRRVGVCVNDTTLSDTWTPVEVEAVHKVFYQLLADLKLQNQQVHLSLSGGRRIMALLALEAAMQYLAPTDHIWHIYTPPNVTEKLRNEGLLHAPSAADIRLVPVPFVPWAAYFPGLRPLLHQSVVESQPPFFGWLDPLDRERCRQVWEALTTRQRDVLRAYALGMGRQQTARQLSIAVTTVDSHRKAIANHCQLAWDTETAGEINIHFFRDKFGPFLKARDEV